MYRVGLPFWRFMARRGVPMYLRVNVLRDSAASVFVATSPDLDGLVVEAETMDELVTEARELISMLLGDYLSSDNYAEPELRLKGGRVAA